MFRDYDKYLRASLKVYLFVLCIVFIMKIVGLDYFGLTINNTIIIKVSDFLVKTHLADLINYITVWIQFYFYLCVVCKKSKLYKWSFIGASINIFLQVIIVKFISMDWLYEIICILIALILPMIVNKKVTIKRQLIYILIINIYQLISLFIRNVSVNNNYCNFLLESILNIDQLLLWAITYNLYFMKGDRDLCGQDLVAGSSLQKKLNLKKLQRKLQENLHNFKQYDKETKLTIIIYSILSLFWNIFTLVIVLLFAKLNNTFIECIFIITSFWLTKTIFGKPFHLNSMFQCFLVSNLSYYILNKLTTPLGISILIPILLGVGLSYGTSKLVKKMYKPLYRGMPKDLFEETILKVTDKDSTKYKVCYDYFINKKSTIYLAGKYNYSEAGIKKIKDRINKKIKELE